MTDLLERLEAMGRRGGAIALAAGVAVLAVSVGIGVYTVWFPVEEIGQWGSGGLRFGALLLAAVGVVYTMVGVRLLTRTEYPSAAEIFPPMTVDEFIEVVRSRHGEICVCTHCRVQVPTEFSTGSCPVCGSSVEYHEVRNEEDAKMVISAVS